LYQKHHSVLIKQPTNSHTESANVVDLCCHWDYMDIISV